MRLQLTIPIRPELKKFLAFKTGCDVDPFQIDRHRDPLSLFLFAVICKRYRFRRDKKTDSFTDTLVVQTTHDQVLENRFHITSESILQINNFLKMQLYDSLIAFIDYHTSQGKQKKESVYAFGQMLGMQKGEVPYERWIKRYQRHEKAVAIGKKKSLTFFCADVHRSMSA